jgi:hypothetical protein
MWPFIFAPPVGSSEIIEPFKLGSSHPGLEPKEATVRSINRADRVEAGESRASTPSSSEAKGSVWLCMHRHASSFPQPLIRLSRDRNASQSRDSGYGTI